MNKYMWILAYAVLIGIAVLGCTAKPGLEAVVPDTTKETAVSTTLQPKKQETPTENPSLQQEINAKTPRLTLESTSDEIREKMLLSSFNWQTLEVEGFFENSSLNPDNSVAYTLTYENHIWIDQENLCFRSEGKQSGVDASSSLAISDGNVMVSRAVSSVIDGVPRIPDATYVHPISAFIADGNTMDLLRSGETIFPPMGSVFSGQLRGEIFSSSYAVQYPGEYKVLGLESIAGRETLKVFYDEADRWGRFNIQHTLWIDTETGVVLKAWSDGTPIHMTEGMEITRIVYNHSIDDVLFNVEEAIPDLKLSEIQSDTVADTTIYAGNLQIEDDNISLDVCYELPSDADWMLFDMMVNGNERVNPNGYLLYMEPAGIFHTKGMRCYQVSFSNTITGQELHFEIGQLFAPAREGEGCMASEQVSQALQEAGTPVEFTCNEDHGMTNMEIISKPETMTEDEARMKVGELLVQFRNESLPGPWVFDLKLQDQRSSAIQSAAPDLKIASMQAVTVDGYTIYAGNLTVEGEQVTLDVCYELPSNSQWLPYEIRVEGKEQTNIHGDGLYMEPAGTFEEKGFRCDTMTFTHALEEDVLHFEVGQLYSAAREGDPCDVSDWVSQDLIDAGTPVEFSCEAQSGVAKTEVLTWSERLTKEEARLRVEALFEQYRVEIQPGPWVFEIPVNRD